MRFVKLSLLALVLLALGRPATTYADEILFESNFESTPVGHRPAHVQAIGTATVAGDPQSLLVAETLKLGPALSIYRTGGKTAEFTGRFAHFHHDGNYTMHFDAFITPSSDSTFTVELQPRDLVKPGPLEFLRLDFLPTRRIRFDKAHVSKVLYFPQDLVVVDISLSIANSHARVHIQTADFNGIYSTDYEIQPGLFATAQQFGSFSILVDPPAVSEIDIGDIFVTHCYC